jgi:DNA invertase Pin-like site-specific DNA recombinase
MTVVAYSYMRCSAKRQERGDTKRRQLEWSERIVAQRGYRLDTEFNLQDWGRSAFRSSNIAVGNLGRFLDAVRRGRIAGGSVLLLESLDRLSRDYLDEAMEVFNSILRGGVTIVTREPERDYTKERMRAEPFANMEPLIVFIRANEESRAKSMRARAQWDKRKRTAKESFTPHSKLSPAWCRLTDTGYVLDEDDAATVRKVFSMACGGLGAYRIAEWMKRHGRPVVGRCKCWSNVFIRSLLRGRAVRGEYQPTKFVEVEVKVADKIRVKLKRVPDGEPIPGYYPAVVTEDQWRAAQAALDGRRKKAGRPGRPGNAEANLLTGIAFEAHTGAPMLVQPSAPKGGTRIAYLATYRPGGTHVRYDAVEEAVLSLVAQLGPKDVVDDPAEVDDRLHAIDRLTRERDALTHRQATLAAKTADPDTPPEQLETILQAVGDVQKRRERVVAELDGLKAEANSGRTEDLAEAQTLIQMLKMADTAQRDELRLRIKAALRQVVTGVWVRAQNHGKRTKVVHLQVYFRNSAMRYVRVVPDHLGVRPLDLRGQDFRLGTNPGEQE